MDANDFARNMGNGIGCMNKTRRGHHNLENLHVKLHPNNSSEVTKSDNNHNNITI